MLEFSRKKKAVLLAAALALPLGAVVLFSFPPSEYGFYPPCVLHQLTGLHCPGCGATRCLHALLHGDLAQAAAYNILFVLALPFLVPWVLCSVGCWWQGKPIP